MPKSSTRSGVISAPPPIPVRPDDEADESATYCDEWIHGALLGRCYALLAAAPAPGRASGGRNVS